jgi:hypothetical protein
VTSSGTRPPRSVSPTSSAEAGVSMSGPTAAQRRAWGRMGALRVHGNGRTNVKAAHEALRLKFEKEADPGGVLDPQVRARRGAQLRRAFLIQMSLKAADARRSHKKAVPVIETPGTAHVEVRRGSDERSAA